MTESAARELRRFLCWLGWHKWETEFERQDFTTLCIDVKAGTEKVETSKHYVPYDLCLICGKRK